MFEIRFYPLPFLLMLPSSAAGNAIGLPAGWNELRRRGARLHTSGSYGLTGRSPHRPQVRMMQRQVPLRMTIIQAPIGIGSQSRNPQPLAPRKGLDAVRGGRPA